MKTILEMTVIMIPTVPRMIIIGGETENIMQIKIKTKRQEVKNERD